ncbi:MULTISPECIES: DUF6221 family protein [unclassified Streptomyces]|uniref:DUF6221 family protein n=1 Tax=unclassified Streptomyces TaxID=2593676 RepID=UPI0035DCE7C2
MDDLMAFIRARLDEDEQTARAAAEPESWMELDREPRPSWYVQYWADPDVAAVIADPESSAYPVVTTAEGMSEDDADRRAAHIARHDPARVLAEVEAKRRILSAYENYDNDAPELDVPESVLRLLALPYADHPDYRKEWRP